MKGKEQRKPKRITLTLWWWLGQVIGWWLIIGPISRLLGGEGFTLLTGSIFLVSLIFQAIIQWKLLMKYYPVKRKNNILLVCATPFFIIIGLGIIFNFEVVFASMFGGLN